MSTQETIAQTIAEAFAALSAMPDYNAKIKKLQDDLDLARYEIECRTEEERRLDQLIKDLYSARDELRSELDEANETIKRMTDAANDTNVLVRQQGHRISELTTDLEAERIKNKMLHDTQAMLRIQLDDSCSLTHKLRATLTRILGEANEVLPEVKPAATFPVEGSEAKSEPVSQSPEPLVASNPVANEIATEQTIWGKSEDISMPDPRQFTEWGF